MKQLLSLLLCVIMLIAACSASSEELQPGTEASWGYTFDLRFHLNADVFPEDTLARARGYADLLELIRLKGKIIFSPDSESLEIDASIIPVTEPSSAISFHLAGIPSHMVMTSPLLGDISIFFNNLALLEFACKTYNQLKLPLPYLTLLIPYCSQVAFSGVVKEWEAMILPSAESGEISSERFTQFADSIIQLREDDPFLRFWFYAFMIHPDNSMQLETELSSIPYYLVNRLSGGQPIFVEHLNNDEVWKNKDGVFFRSVSDRFSSQAEAMLPETDTGYTPVLNFSLNADPACPLGNITLNLSYSGENDSLLALDCAASFPLSWPLEGTFSAYASQHGLLLPEFDLTADIVSSASGDFALSVHEERRKTEKKEGKETVPEIFHVSGTVLPVISAPLPVYTAQWAMQYLNVFSVNDENINQLFSQILHSALRGLLAFGAEVPATSFQSVLDDLTDYGIIDLFLGE